MNICIVSVVNSPNQGSYQQLKELGDAYLPYGNVFYLDNGIRNIFDGLLGFVLGCLRRGKFKKAIFEIQRRMIFRSRYKKLNIIKNDRLCEMDLIVLGSDEIWNYKRDNMKHSFLWGSGMSTVKASYAPSVGNAQADSFENSDFFLSALTELDMVSVRDVHSKQVLRDIGYEGDVRIVVDPSFLRSKEKYKSTSTFNYRCPYIALYCFQGLFEASVNDFSIFKEFAKSKGLEIVSGGSWSDYAKSIHSKSSGAFDFMIDCEYVITNTFHGTAFAINFNKPFITFSYGREEKILNMLKEFGLEHRDCTNKSNDEIIRILDTPIDYYDVNKKLGQMRNDSLEYIKRTVELASDKNRNE